ncbi:MAG: hypothetical protein L3K24_13670 [Gammaproteobacteria bacterium]|nr:hypothetical protein [Gammaproteobacteria bacterium]
MKKFIPVILGVSVIGISGYFYFLTERSVVETAVIDKSYLESDSAKKNKVDGIDTEFNVSLLEQKNVSEPDEPVREIPHAKLQEMVQITAVHREEIDGLIQQFDTNLSDPVARKNIKREIDAKMSDYNETVLPVAMNAMKERSSSGYKD